jgi:hypothetical protein
MISYLQSIIYRWAKSEKLRHSPLYNHKKKIKAKSTISNSMTAETNNNLATTLIQQRIKYVQVRIRLNNRFLVKIPNNRR